MSSSPAQRPIPEGLGSVSGAPHLPDGIADTFTSRYVDSGSFGWYRALDTTIAQNERR